MRITLTPQMAKDLLARSTNYRKTVPGFVRQMARDITSDKFPYTGQPIITDALDQLQDGFHRCEAVVMADRSIDVELVAGVPSSAVDYMDHGRRRSLGDVLHHHGEKNPTSLGSTINFSYRWNKNGCHPMGRPAPSIPEALKWLENHPELREALLVGERFRKKWRITQTVGGSFWHKVATTVDQETGNEFRDLILGDGADLAYGSPILATRNWLQNQVLTARDVKPSEGLVIAFLTLGWNAWIQLRDIKVLTWRPRGGKKPFPVLLDLDGRPVKFENDDVDG